MKRVVVIGGGFGGLLIAKNLGRADDLEVTLVDRQNFHLFQPLAYQVATGALSSAEIATPLRQILRRQKNTHVLLAEVTGFDLDARAVQLTHLPNGEERRELEYDVLAVSGGSAYSYFGHDDWAAYAPELKSLHGALDLRSRILSAFEAAEVELDAQRRSEWLTFVVVGGGPTGVEMAGQIGELAHDALRRDYRIANPSEARVLLVEATERLLGTFPESLSRSAVKQLTSLGVTPMLSTTVVGVEEGAVQLQAADGELTTVPARTAVWAAGVTASPLAQLLADAAGVETDRAGRLPVGPDLTLAGHPEVFALGDMVAVRDQPLPGVAPVAMQQGRFVAKAIRTGSHTPFHYRDKGNLATIGRRRAVADVKGLHFSGFLAWALWLGVHLFYLIGFQNRLIVLTRWTFSYFTRGRNARVIQGRVSAGSSARGEGLNQAAGPTRPVARQ